MKLNYALPLLILLQVCWHSSSYAGSPYFEKVDQVLALSPIEYSLKKELHSLTTGVSTPAQFKAFSAFLQVILKNFKYVQVDESILSWLAGFRKDRGGIYLSDWENYKEFARLTYRIQNDEQAEIYIKICEDAVDDFYKVSRSVLGSNKMFFEIENKFQKKAYLELLNRFDTTVRNGSRPVFNFRTLNHVSLRAVQSVVWEAMFSIKTEADLTSFSEVLGGIGTLQITSVKAAEEIKQKLISKNLIKDSGPVDRAVLATQAVKHSYVSKQVKSELHDIAKKVETEMQLNAFLEAIDVLGDGVAENLENTLWFIDQSTRITNSYQHAVYVQFLNEMVHGNAEEFARAFTQSPMFFMRIQNEFQAAAHAEVLHQLTKNHLHIRYLDPESFNYVPRSVTDAAFNLQSEADLELFKVILGQPGEKMLFDVSTKLKLNKDFEESGLLPSSLLVEQSKSLRSQCDSFLSGLLSRFH